MIRKSGCRFSEKIMLYRKVERAASVQLKFQTTPISGGRGFRIGLILYAPRIRMMRRPTVAMPDLVLADVGDQPGVPLLLRQGDVADALADPGAAFRAAAAGHHDLQPRQALLDNLAGIGMVVLRRRFKKYNHWEILLCCGDQILGSSGHAVVRGSLHRLTFFGPYFLRLGNGHGARPLSVCGILRRAALPLLPQLRRADGGGRLAAAVSATMLVRLRAPIKSVHV